MRLAFRIKARAPGNSAAAAARYEKWADMTGAEAAFRNPETKSESQHVDAVTKKKDLDVPRRQLWRRTRLQPTAGPRLGGQPRPRRRSQLRPSSPRSIRRRRHPWSSDRPDDSDAPTGLPEPGQTPIWR